MTESNNRILISMPLTDDPPLPQVASLCLSASRLLLETGANGRTVHEACNDIVRALGCDSAEVLCQHAAILITIHRGSESFMQMSKVSEHGVHLRRTQAVRQIIRDLAAGKMDFAGARLAIDRVPETAGSYPVWFVCVATGLACGAFGRLLGADWPSFLPIAAASAGGQWLRQALIRQRHNVFVVAGVISFVSAFLAGLGARLCGSGHIANATVAAVLLLVPGVAVLNAQIDILEGKPNLAAARALRVLYLLMFMALGLVLAQTLVLPPLPDVPPSPTAIPPVLYVLHQAFFGGVAAAGFAVLFHCQPRMLPLCAGAGALALAVRTIGQELDCSLAVASFFAALLLASANKAWRESPSPRGSVLAVVGVIPMIPGSLAAKVFISVFTFLRSGQSPGVEATVATWDNLLMLIFTLAAIGTGLALPSLVPAAKAGEER
jgi:uncharacterized membrane protein YjjP (DUF1212 family)